MKHIVYIITSADIGGAQKHLLSLCRGAKAAGYRVSVICSEHGQLIEELASDGIACIVEPQLHKQISVIQDMKAIYAIARHLRRLRPSIVHCHSSKAGIVGRIAAKLSRIPCIMYTAHGYIFNDHTLSVKKRLLYEWFERLGGWLSDAVITVSKKDFALAAERKVVSPNRMRVIYNGIVETFAPREAREPAVPVIGTIARLVKDKNLHLWIDTAVELQSALPHAEFIIVGSGPLMSELQQYADNKGLRRLTWAGEQSDIAPYLHQFDVFLLTSVKEGLPTTLLESLGSGLPVVSTDVGGVREIIDDRRCGLVVSSFAPADLCQAVIYTLEQEQVHQSEWTKHRQNRQKTLFSEARMIEETFGLYKHALEQKGLIR